MPNLKKPLFFILANFLITSAIALVNINTATETELESLPTIGPARAKSIIDYRNQHGAFASVEALKKVPGIKNLVYTNIKKDITVTEATSLIKHDEPLTSRTGKITKRRLPKVKQ